MKVSYVDDESTRKVLHYVWVKYHGTPEYHYERNKQIGHHASRRKGIQCFCFRGYNEKAETRLEGMVNVSEYRYVVNNRSEAQEVLMRCEVPGGKKPAQGVYHC